jgi:site-specific DNA recombinase
VTSPAARRAAIYVRISADREGRELGVERQEEDCRRLAGRKGLHVAYVASDNDISASTRSKKPRPAYKQMLADVKAGTLGAIVAVSSSRLTRRPREWEDLIDLHDETGVHIYFVRSNDPLDLSTARGRRHARDDAARDAEYAEEISELARRERQQRRDQGRWHGGPRPFGFEANGVTPRRLEQALIIQAIDDVLAGRSLGSIARNWTTQGMPTPYWPGPPWTIKAWRPSSVRDIIRNPRVAGMLPGGEPATQWAPLVDEATWRGACAVLADPSRRRSRGATRFLTGIGLCGICGATVNGGLTRAGARTYRCSAVSHLDRAAEPVDTWVTDVLIGYLVRERPRPAPVQDPAPIAAHLAGLRARLGEAADTFAAGSIDGGQLARITQALRAQIEEGEQRLVAAAGSSALADLPLDRDGLRAFWAGADLDRRRAILRASGLRIVVHAPGRGTRQFDPSTVQITGG